jgi:hypothetical protein
MAQFYILSLNFPGGTEDRQDSWSTVQNLKTVISEYEDELVHTRPPYSFISN